ncbi:hypothetical protein M5K25_020359 [Dendrobium thyrsiflorum]|uniref:Uncharacterized protein n=1 Tax=Dendrobium thyrsiflorum TaxID=117978 RepID=A0ABD0UAD6_DENTH
MDTTGRLSYICYTSSILPFSLSKLLDRSSRFIRDRLTKIEMDSSASPVRAERPPIPREQFRNDF